MSSEVGWFDAFRPTGGPLLFADPNRTPSLIDSRILFILLTFTTAEIAFLLVLPGIRKEKISTFIIVTLSLFIGCTITVAHCGSSWHVGESSISSPYRAFSKQKIFADVGVYIGLQSVNITLKARPVYHKNADSINYNERFYWIGATEMKQEYHNALAKGLPYPILTILEYLSKGDEGFCWGRKYRLAGHYGSTLLVMAFALWIFMLILLCAVPRYGIYALQATGALLLSTNAIYSLLLPPNPLRIPFEGATLTFSYGWTYWLVCIAGSLALTIGTLVAIFDTLFPSKFSTILEVDYDTPYRYFVGNDAHLFGGLANNCINNGTCHLQHQRGETPKQLNKPSSPNTMVNDHHQHHPNHHHQSPKMAVSKQKSDASVGTTESYPIVRPQNSLIMSTTRAIIEKQGQRNEAFAAEHGDGVDVGDSVGGLEGSVNSKNNNCISGKSISCSSGSSTAPSTSSATLSACESTNDPNEISTELVHGKRAVSLSNFGRFTARQQQKQQQQIDQSYLRSSEAMFIKSSPIPGTHL